MNIQKLGQTVAFEQLIDIACNWREKGERIVLCHGCFDPFHVGHLEHFNAAKENGDRLITTVTPDCWVNKGSGRPMFSETERCDVLAALRVVDAAAINLWETAAKTIMSIRPHYFVKGRDYLEGQAGDSRLIEEEKAIKEVGGDLIYTNTRKFSATEVTRCLRIRANSPLGT